MQNGYFPDSRVNDRPEKFFFCISRPVGHVGHR